MAPRKELLGAKVRITYHSTVSESITVEGKWGGAQIIAPNDFFFIVLEMKDKDKFIPQESIIDFDVLESNVVDRNDDEKADNYIN